MKNTNQLFRMFATITAIWLAINLVLIPFNWEAVFQNIYLTSGTEIFMFLGMLLIFIFDIAVIVWAAFKKLQGTSSSPYYNYLFAGSIVCFFVLFAAKTIADEVGRESRLGWEISGKYLFFNLLLCLQVLYNIYFIIISKKLEREV